MLVCLPSPSGVTLGGVSVHGSAVVVPGHSRRGRVSRRCLRVLAVAAALSERDGTRAIVFTGGGNGESEAEQMRAAWTGRGDVELLVEPTARTTAENAARSLRVLLDHGIADATVVCAPQHVLRVRYLFGGLYARFGVTCRVHPAWRAPHPFALAREVGAMAVMRRQRRAVLAELESGPSG